MIQMTNDFSLDLEAVLDSHVSLAVLAAVDASVAEAAEAAEDVVEAAGVAAAEDVDAAAVNQLLEYRFQINSSTPCMSAGVFFILYI